MEKESTDVTQDSSPEQVEETQETTLETVSEDVKTPDSEPETQSENKTVPYDRFKAVNDELNRLKNTPKAPQPEGKLQTRDISDEEINDLRFDGYSKQEAKRIVAFAKAGDITIEEARGFLKASIDAERANIKAKENTPPPSKRGTQSATKGFRDIISSPEATKAQKQAAFQERMNRLKNKGDNRTE